MVNTKKPECALPGKGHKGRGWFGPPPFLGVMPFQLSLIPQSDTSTAPSPSPAPIFKLKDEKGCRTST